MATYVVHQACMRLTGTSQDQLEGSEVAGAAALALAEGRRAKVQEYHPELRAQSECLAHRNHQEGGAKGLDGHSGTPPKWHRFSFWLPFEHPPPSKKKQNGRPRKKDGPIA